MTRNAALLFIALVAALPLAAQDRGIAGEKINEYAQFCDGPYALCIKAPCTPVVTYDKTENTWSITAADCACIVETGWSMGPAACDSPARKQKTGGRAYLMSTYSNFFNKTDLTLTCGNPDTLWAWCYGAPCVVDNRDPKKATCTCPLQTSPMKTLGGNCKPDACNSLWSAASYAEDWFANNYFYKYMTDNKLTPPPNKPAQDCPTPHPTPN